MKRGCLLSLLLWAALIYGYSLWIGQTLQGRELWISSVVAGLLATFCIGALFNAYYAWRDGRVLNDAISDLPRQHGQRTAVAGTIEPLRQPIIAPLSGEPCVLYEYDIYRMETRTSSQAGRPGNQASDFSGLGMAECVIKSTSSRLRLLGLPDLDPLEAKMLTEQDDYARAKQFVQFTDWEDTSGLDLLHGIRDMFAALTGEFESLEKNWRIISVHKCPWLSSNAPSAPKRKSPKDTETDDFETHLTEDTSPQWEDEAVDFSAGQTFENDPDEEPAVVAWNDGTGYRPYLKEKRIHCGQQVIILGQYDEMRQGIISGGSQPIKIYLENVQTVAQKLNSKKWTNLIGGLIAMVILNLVIWGMQALARRHHEAEHAWHRKPVNFLSVPCDTKAACSPARKLRRPCVV